MPRIPGSKSWRCVAGCGAIAVGDLVLTDSRGRPWHVKCAAEALGQITRHDEDRGARYRYWWDWPKGE